jgi:hypothetical protein
VQQVLSVGKVSESLFAASICISSYTLRMDWQWNSWGQDFPVRFSEE